MYDEAKISALFQFEATQADEEYRQALALGGSGQDLDAILARSSVYGYLYARYFLESAELLVNELRWLRRTGRPPAPAHAVDVERFGRARDALLDALIARFGNEPGAR